MRRLIFTTTLTALALGFWLTAGAGAGKLHGVDYSRHHPHKVHHVRRDPPKPPKLTGRALWRRQIDRRFCYWGKRLGRHWSVAERDTAYRVVSRESGWNPRASNGGTYRGLFQIWYSHAPGRNLYDPLVNIEVAAQLWARRGWSPWSQTAY